MDFKSFIIKFVELIKGTLIGKVILALITGGLSLLGTAPFFDKYISAALDKYLSINTSEPSTLIGICLVLFGIALAVWERKNQILIETKKIEVNSIKIKKPIIDICHRGISVKEIGKYKVFFDIPYCAGKDTNAHNVKLENALISPRENGLFYVSKFGDEFPENITLTYETGKSMNYSLSPFTIKQALDSYIVVKGSYTDECNNIHNVFDIFKFSTPTNSWVRTLGNEDKRVREFVTNSAAGWVEQ